MNNLSHYMWLLHHTKAMLDEKAYRDRRVSPPSKHKCYEVYEFCRDNALFVPSDENKWTDPPNCTPYKDEELITAYRHTLIEKWQSDKSLPRWSRRGPPAWIVAYYDGDNDNDGGVSQSS
jgi:hypothetical protein